MVISWVIKLLLSIISSLLLLAFLACLGGLKLSPAWFSYSAFCSLLFPYIYLVVCIWSLLAVWFNWKLIIPLGLALILGYPQISFVFVFPSSSSSVTEGQKTLRMMSWNVGSFSKENYKTEDKKSIKKSFFEIVSSAKADIICLQEVWLSKQDNWISQLAQKQTFPFVKYGGTFSSKSSHYKGSVILSKFPILPSPKVRNEKLKNDLASAIIQSPHHGSIHVLNIHLQSNHIQKEMLEKIVEWDIIKEQEKIVSFADKIGVGSHLRLRQIEEVNTSLSKTKYPTLICVDLNEVAGSYNYKELRQDKWDAFLEYGSWFRFSFPKKQASVGIDYIFTDKKIPPFSYIQLEKTISDHLPHYIDF